MLMLAGTWAAGGRGWWWALPVLIALVVVPLTMVMTRNRGAPTDSPRRDLHP